MAYEDLLSILKQNAIPFASSYLAPRIPYLSVRAARVSLNFKSKIKFKSKKTKIKNKYQISKL
jgi:hypothetical protein